jgi:hypothetical protein
MLLAGLRIGANTNSRLLETTRCNRRCRVPSFPPIHASRTFIRQAGDENRTQWLDKPRE